MKRNSQTTMIDHITNSIIKLLIIAFLIVAGTLTWSSMEFEVSFKKESNSFLKSVGNIADGTVGAYKTITKLGSK